MDIARPGVRSGGATRGTATTRGALGGLASYLGGRDLWCAPVRNVSRGLSSGAGLCSAAGGVKDTGGSARGEYGAARARSTVAGELSADGGFRPSYGAGR